MNSNNHNSSCNFSDVLVSYLYDEIGEKEKLRFESHILDCGVCTDEISAFGGVRSSVHDWREQEFATLPTPFIELPSAPQQTISTIETNTASRSWLAGLRELFSLSPAWASAATACAALAICAGLFYAAFSSMQSDRNVAGTNKNASVSSVPSPTVDNSAANNAETRDAQPVETPKPEIAVGDKKQNSPKLLRGSEKTVAADKTDVKLVKANNLPKEKPATNNRKLTKQPADIEFTTREEEDKSLRLTDLFDEVSMK